MRYQYSSDGFKKDFYGPNKFFQFNAVNSICILHIIIFLFFNPFVDISNFGVHPINFKTWQLISYMFIHANLLHIVFNLYILWIFGPHIESILGTKKFIIYYFLTGIFSGICCYSISFSPLPTIGASGAIFAIIIAYSYFYPNRIISFWFIPCKAQTVGLILFCSQLILFLLQIKYPPSHGDGGISYISHLGGMCAGYLYLKFGRFIIPKIRFLKKKKEKRKVVNINDIDKILDKLKLEGWDGLTDSEKSKLYKASKEKQQDTIN